MENESDFQRMLAHCRGLSETEQSLSILYTKFLWALSGGAIGLSVTLVSGAFGARLEHGFCSLMGSWIAFGLCIVLTMSTVKTSEVSFRKELESIYRELRETGNVSQLEYRGSWVCVTLVLEIFAAIAAVTGTVLLLVFIGQNV